MCESNELCPACGRAYPEKNPGTCKRCGGTVPTCCSCEVPDVPPEYGGPPNDALSHATKIVEAARELVCEDYELECGTKATDCARVDGYACSSQRLRLCRAFYDAERG